MSIHSSQVTLLVLRCLMNNVKAILEAYLRGRRMYSLRML